MGSTVMSSFLVLALCTINIIIAGKLPETFQRCSKKDPKLNECLSSAIEKAIRELKPGLPSLHILPIDPLDITQIVIQEGVGRPVNIKLNLNNVKVNGLSKAVLHNLRADLNKRVIEVDGDLPFSFLDADYEMDGHFLVLPIRGKGKCRLEFTNLKAHLKLTAEEKKKDGKVFWNVVKFDVLIKDMDKFKVNFENLFNGDKALGDNTNKVLNENWKTFWEELKPSFEETFGKIFLQVSNTLFSRVPENDIFLN